MEWISFFHAFSDVLFIWSQLWNRLTKLFGRWAQKSWWRILYAAYSMHHRDFCAELVKTTDGSSLLCHDGIVTLFIYYYWRTNVENRVFVEAIFRIWRFFEIFNDFHGSSSGQCLSTNHLLKCQSHLLSSAVLQSIQANCLSTKSLNS